MNQECGNEGCSAEKEEVVHKHRWSLIKDRDFYTQSDLISRYFESSQCGVDCPHVDSPIVDAVETLAYVFYSASPLPDSPMIRTAVMNLMEGVGLLAFSAGIRFERDGNKLDSEAFTRHPLDDGAGENRKWNEERAASIHDWRENMREMFYRKRPNQMPKALRDILEGITGKDIDPDAQVMVATPEIMEVLKTAGVSIPYQSGAEQKSGIDGTGLYL